ncbi:MAG: hypothetical protein KC535_03020 [Nanoarchaeota archaeon]|nr:hypothetical protein [Nanoarchaeota archaeon]
MFPHLAHDVDLKKFSSLIGQESLGTKEQLERIHFWLSQFQKDDFSHLPQFKQELLELLNHMDHIRTLVKQDELMHLHQIHEFLLQLIKTHILEKVDKKEKLRRLFEKALSELFADFEREAKNGADFLRSKNSRESLKSLFLDMRLRQKTVAADALRELKLSDQVQEDIDSLLQESQAIALGKKDVGAYLYDDLKRIVHAVVAQFDLFQEEFLEQELQESDLVKSLRSLSRRYPQFQDHFNQMSDQVISRLRRDVELERRKIKGLQNIKRIFLTSSL